MSEDYSGNIISISDEDGNNYELEHLDTIEMDGVFYLAFLPVNDGKGDEDLGMVIMKTETGEDGEEYLVVPTDEEIDRAYDRFMEEFFDDGEDDGE